MPFWLWTIGLACAGPDRGAIERAVAAAEGEPATLVDDLLRPGVGVLPEPCAAQLLKARTSAPADRPVHYAVALRDICPATCASDVFPTLAGLPPEEKLPALLRGCDAKGADPVFGDGSLRALRPRMDGMEYLVARMVLDPALRATSWSPIGERLRAVLPALAASMVAAADAAAKPPRVTVGSVDVADVDAGSVEAELSRTRAGIEACGAGAPVAGEIAVTVLVDAVGRANTNLDAPEPLWGAASCIDQVIRFSWRLPPASGGGLGTARFTVRVGAP